jgi:hypothetical protein
MDSVMIFHPDHSSDDDETEPMSVVVVHKETTSNSHWYWNTRRMMMMMMAVMQTKMDNWRSWGTGWMVPVTWSTVLVIEEKENGCQCEANTL